jgi:hypothetical protein
MCVCALFEINVSGDEKLDNEEPICLKSFSVTAFVEGILLLVLEQIFYYTLYTVLLNQAVMLLFFFFFFF